MKNALIIILLAATVVFGGLYFSQKQRTGLTEANLTNAQKSLADLQAQVDAQEKGKTKLQERLEDTRVEADSKAGQVAELRQALTNRPAVVVKTNEANPFAGMFKSPEMRNMIKNQQKAMMGTMIDKNYADFFASMNLTPDQSAALKDLLSKRMMVNTDAGLSMMADDMTPEKRAELTKQMKTDTDAVNDQIKQFLGDDNYTQFQNYEKTQPERSSVSQFKDQLGTGPNAMTSDQQQQLQQAMGEERNSFKFTTDFNDQSKFNGDPGKFFTEDRLNQYFAEQEKLNQRYLDRAGPIMTADQLSSYKTFLDGQLAMQKMGMQMAAKMFSAKSPN